MDGKGRKIIAIKYLMRTILRLGVFEFMNILLKIGLLI